MEGLTLNQIFEFGKVKKKKIAKLAECKLEAQRWGLS